MMGRTKQTKKRLNKTLLIVGILTLILVGSAMVFVKPGAASEAQTLQANLVDSINPEEATPADKVVIYFFWGEGCPHCAAAKPILQAMVDENPQLVLKSFEVYNDPASQEIFKRMTDAYGFEPRAVPTIMVADRYWEGFNDSVEAEIKSTIATCLSTGCTDLGADIIAAFETPATPAPVATETPSPEPTQESDNAGSSITLPLIGTVDLSGKSNLVSTLLIAFVDGVNPCSIWVLTMLLSITLHSGSRKKILIVGLVYISVTALIYALFIAGMFTVFSVINFAGWIRTVVALVALFFGLVNLKDYFWYKEGISFTIDDKSKPGIYKRMRKIMDAGDSTWGLIGGTIVLAAGVSLVEFSCTAGFPVLWTNLLTAQQVTAATFIILLLVYMFIYQLDELGIFLVAVFTLKSSKIEEKHGRILKLIGGVLMITLAVVMLVNPSLMSDLGSSLIIFTIAFGVSALILLLHRTILPKMGVYLGSEMKASQKKQYQGRSRKR